MNSSDVYLGFWTNWSKNGRALGATLTTTREAGNLLLAFTGFFVSFVASRLWRIFCVALHEHHSTSRPRDAVHHQRQVILRNSTSPDAGLLSLCQLLWAWRRAGARHTLRVLPAAVLALFLIVAFVVAGGYSSRISTLTGDDVLLVGDNCGILYNSGGGDAQTNSVMVEIDRNEFSMINYAQQCYATPGLATTDCDMFVVPSLPTAVTDTNASCPFEEAICRHASGNIRLDTGYLDSNDDLGINAPEDQRLGLRYVLQCAPLTSEGLTTRVTVGNDSLVRYNYGAHLLRDEVGDMTQENYTYQIEDLDAQYGYARLGQFVNPPSTNFMLDGFWSGTVDGVPNTTFSNFVPASQLLRPDGDVSVLFLSGNGVVFGAPAESDWYRGTVAISNTSSLYTNQGDPLYMPEEAAAALGCVEQYQFCSSAGADRQCGPLGSLFDSYFGAGRQVFNLTDWEMGDNPDWASSSTTGGARLVWPYLVFMYGVPDVQALAKTLGAKSLSSQSLLYSGVQYALPANQWQLDVMYWWDVMLASMQAAYVNAARGSADPVLHAGAHHPNNSAEWNLCNSQKIRSTAHASISVFGLCFTYITGLLIILVSYVAEPVLHARRRRRKHGEYANLEWITNGTLQLHRLAHEDGERRWDGSTDTVPTTEPDVLLTSLNIADLKHPILSRPSDITLVGKKVGTWSDKGSQTGGKRQKADMPVRAGSNVGKVDISPGPDAILTGPTSDTSGGEGGLQIVQDERVPGEVPCPATTSPTAAP